MIISGLLFREKTSAKYEQSLPFITVIIAARNEEDNLPSLLDDLVNQKIDKNKFVVIIANDRSIDKTEEIKSVTKFPKLFNVLKMGGGVTNYADLSKIEIVRNNPIKNGGGKKKAEINLIDLIINGNQEKNIYIQDDDIIHIPKSEKVIKEQFLAINKINLNPKLINIIISGDVLSAGNKTLKKGSTLVQAISSSGGKKVFSGKVEFIRFNNEGDVERRLMRFDKSAKVDSYNNPILIEGDIINVKRSPIGTLTEVLDEFSRPVVSTYFLLDIFRGS